MEKGKDFGELAIERTYVTRDQLAEALAEQRRLRALGNRPFLGEVMVELGLLTLDGLFALLELGRGYHERDELSGDGWDADWQPRFGDLAVRKGYCTAVELFNALQLQRDEELSRGVRRLIGEILLDRGHLTPWELEDVIVTLADLSFGAERTGETPACGFSTEPFERTGERRSKRPHVMTGTRKSVLSAPTIAEVMAPVPGVVSPYATVAAAREAAADRGSPHLLVFEFGELVGTLDVQELADARLDGRVLELMRTPLITIGAAASVEDAARLMRDSGAESLPVTVGGLVVGLVTIEELRRANVSRDLMPEPDLRPYEELGGGD